jgi:predicted PurR-regulated permease PerM
MSTADDTSRPEPAAARGRSGWWELVKKLAIWGGFLAVLYLARHFFFIAFMTFLFCWLTLAVVGWGMRRLARGQERPGLRRLLTVGVFILVPLVLVGVGSLVAPPLLAQGRRLVGWMNHVDPETEVSRLVEGFVGPSQFRAQYGTPADPRYQKALEEFRQTGVLYVTAYHQFPNLEAWVEGGFKKQFADEQRARLRVHLVREGTSSKEFEEWFLHEKVPELKEQGHQQVPAKGRPSAPVDPLVRAAAAATPEQLLQQVRREPARLAALRQEWMKDAVEQQVVAALPSPAYQEQFQAYYEKQRAQSPQVIPYTFEQYVELQNARSQGQVAFGQAMDRIKSGGEADAEARLRADFEAAKEHELFKEWWSTSPTAQSIRQQIETNMKSEGRGRGEEVLASLLNIPADLATALLLSFFICIDFPRLSRGVKLLRETWLREVYEEMAPALTRLGHLVGRAMSAQGLIALCNAVTMFLALTLLGVEHAVLLGVATFVLCLVPTLGMVLAWALISVCALLQPGGGVILALKASGAVLFVMLLEVFVFSPRFLGRAMELHPVLILAILPLAQYFFGIWGLILATPVAVYVVHVIVLGRELPGLDRLRQAKEAAPAAGAVDGPPARAEPYETAQTSSRGSNHE